MPVHQDGSWPASSPVIGCRSVSSLLRGLLSAPLGRDIFSLDFTGTSDDRWRIGQVAARSNRAYRTVVDRAPSNDLALSGLARTEARLGQWDSAIAHSEQSVRLNPRNSFAFAALGNLYVLVRHYDRSAKACAQAVALNPSSVLAVFCAIQVLLARGDMAGARAAVRATSPAVGSTFLYEYSLVMGSTPGSWILGNATRCWDCQRAPTTGGARPTLWSG